MKTYTLVYFIDQFNVSGGMERVLVTKVNYLVNIGCDVSIILNKQINSDSFFSLDEKVNVYPLGIRYNDVSNIFKYNLYKKKKFYNQKRKEHRVKVEKLLNEIKPDIAISLLAEDFSFLYKIKDGSKKIVEFHFSREGFSKECERARFPFISRIQYYHFILKKTKSILKKYDSFVNLTYQDYQDWGALKNATVIPNPIISEIEKDRYPDYNQKKVLSVGRMVFQKGFDFLIKAWKEVSKDYPEWILTIIGGGDSSSFKELIKELGLEQKIILLSPKKNIEDYYYDSSIYVSSSRYEGFPMTLLEAASCGLPIVSFNCPTGPSEIINHGQDGLLAEYENVSDLAYMLKSMMKNKDKRKFMGKNAKENIQQFSQDIIMKKWMDLFEKLKE